MISAKKIFIAAGFAVLAAHAFCDEGEKLLRFKYKKDENYRVLSTVNETVKLNGRVHHQSEIVNRVTAKITDVDEKGRGLNEGNFMTTENTVTTDSNGAFTLGEEYYSKFWRDELGIYQIENKYFMPTVRDCPVFPKKAVKPGDSWTGVGHEAHDLRRLFSSDEPYKVPFTATYTYLRDEGKFQVIQVKYSLFFESPIPENTFRSFEDFPVTTMGFSDQTIWWDNEKGQIDHYSENFRIDMETFYGERLSFSGKAHAEVSYYERSSTDKQLEKVRDTVKKLDIKDVSVEKTEKGLKISLENIQFRPESALLLNSEKAKIEKIAKILEGYSNDLLVSGHTARSGSEQSCQELSEKRANAVASYLILKGVRDRYHIFTKGFGAKVPIASNDTEEGKAKNRRVEITILDK